MIELSYAFAVGFGQYVVELAYVYMFAYTYDTCTFPLVLIALQMYNSVQTTERSACTSSVYKFMHIYDYTYASKLL